MAANPLPQRERTIEPSAEDRTRLARLHEEIEGRQSEMALIIARVLGWDVGKGKLLAFSLPAHYPWATVAESQKIKSLLLTRGPVNKFKDAGSDGGSIVVTLGDITVLREGGVYDCEAQTCHE